METGNHEADMLFMGDYDSDMGRDPFELTPTDIEAESLESQQIEDITLAVDEKVPQGEVVARIERVIEELVYDVAQNVEPTLHLISRKKPLAVSSQAVAVSRSVQTRNLSFTVSGALPFARVIQVLSVAHELLRTNRQATLRDIYYKLLSPPLFNNPQDVNSAISDAVALLRVPRGLMGICCASRGSVSGRLCIKDSPMSPWQDCTNSGIGGRSIPGSISEIECLRIRADAARYLIIVEKDAVFQALTQDQIHDLIPCILVTAKGMPDIATRAFCSRIIDEYPNIKVLGLVDWNPSGVIILRTYKYGSHHNLEGSRYSLPNLRWLGLRFGQLGLVDSSRSRFQPLSKRDRALITGLNASFEGLHLNETAWCLELRHMLDRGVKADIEFLYGTSGGMAGLGQILIQAIVKGDYI